MQTFTSQHTILLLYDSRIAIKQCLVMNIRSFSELAFLTNDDDVVDAIEIVLKTRASEEYKKYLIQRIRDILNENVGVSIGEGVAHSDKTNYLSITFYSV